MGSSPRRQRKVPQRRKEGTGPVLLSEVVRVSYRETRVMGRGTISKTQRQDVDIHTTGPERAGEKDFPHSGQVNKMPKYVLIASLSARKEKSHHDLVIRKYV